MSVMLHLYITIDEGSVKPLVHIGGFRDMVMDQKPTSSLQENRRATKVLTKVLDFAERIEK